MLLELRGQRKTSQNALKSFLQVIFVFDSVLLLRS